MLIFLIIVINVFFRHTIFRTEIHENISVELTFHLICRVFAILRSSKETSLRPPVALVVWLFLEFFLFYLSIAFYVNKISSVHHLYERKDVIESIFKPCRDLFVIQCNLVACKLTFIKFLFKDILKVVFAACETFVAYSVTSPS